VFGDRSVGAAFVELHINYLSLPLGKAEKETFQDFAGLTSEGISFRPRFFCFEGGELLQRSFRFVSSCPEAIKEGVLSDLEEPGGEGDSLPAEVAEPDEGLLKNFGSKVLGRPFVAGAGEEVSFNL